jgi:hypothetical protein
MLSLLQILFLVFAMLLATIVIVAWSKGFHRTRNPFRSFLAYAFHAPVGFLNALLFSSSLTFANVAEGQSLNGMKTYLSDVVVAGRYRLGKIGSTPLNVTTTTTADKPHFILTDEVQTIGDGVVVAVLGAAPGTQKIAINSTVTAGDALTPDTLGYGRTLPTADGTYWIFGIALQSGIAGDIIEFMPCFPRQIQYATAVATSRL